MRFLVLLALLFVVCVLAIILFAQTWLLIPIGVFFVLTITLFTIRFVWRVNRAYDTQSRNTKSKNSQSYVDDSCPKLTFDQGITPEEFEKMAREEASRLPRFAGLRVFDGNVIVSLNSVTGKTRWSFSVDFNDFGELSGRYWLHTENDDSTIPELFAKRMQERLLYRLAHPRNDTEPYFSPPMMWYES